MTIYESDKVSVVAGRYAGLVNLVVRGERWRFGVAFKWSTIEVGLCLDWSCGEAALSVMVGPIALEVAFW